MVSLRLSIPAEAPRGTAALGKAGPAPAPTLNALAGAFTLPENAGPGAVAGTLNGRTAGSALSLTNDAGGRVALSGTNIVRGATALDYETATSHSFTIRETLGGATNSPRETVFTLAVTNVLDAPALSALTLSAASLMEGAAQGTPVGSIRDRTEGSSLALADNAGGRFRLNGLVIEAGITATGYDVAASHDITIRETLADSPNSPRDTVFTIAIAEAEEPGPSRPDFTSTGLTPAFLYHPATEAITIEAGPVIAVAGTDSPDLAAPGTGPEERVDGAGGVCWRFEDGAMLDLPDSFTMTPRAFTILIVGRQHRTANNCYYFGTKYDADGETPINTLGPALRSYGSGNRAPWLGSNNQFSYTAPTNREYGGIGSQMACFGAASRTAAKGAMRLMMNDTAIDLPQAYSAATDCKGGRFGGYFYNNGSTSGFDLYCAVAFHGELSDEQVTAASDVLMGFFRLVPFTRNIILEGDSIVQGVGLTPGVGVTSGHSLGMALSEPGPGLVPPDVRVVNMGVSGAQVTHCKTRRDLAEGWPLLRLGDNANDNIVALQIGRNDTGGSDGLTPAQTYDRILGYWNDAGTGVAARGWSAVQMANIACDSGPASTDLHALILADFTEDVPGGRVIDLQAIEDGGEGFPPFRMASRNAAYYQLNGSTLDTTHPNISGTALMASGGDTPQHGYGAVL